MFSQKELKQIRRRKRVVIARSDLLREEGGQIWDAFERRGVGFGRNLVFIQQIPPAAFMASFAGLAVLRRHYEPRHKYLKPVFTAVGFALNLLAPSETRTPGLPERARPRERDEDPEEE